MERPDCLFRYMGLCFDAAAPNHGSGSIFGLAEFLTAVAILVVAYSITDERYKFRISISKISLPHVFFWVTTIVGIGIVLVRFWFDVGLPIPRFLNSQQYFEGAFALAFILPLSFWIYVAFISPPVFKKSNAARFANRVFRSIADGNEAQIAAVAQEVGRSAQAIFEIAHRRFKQANDRRGGIVSRPPLEAEIARDLVLLLGNRRFCRVVATQFPWVAAELFRFAARSGVDSIPFAQFSRNVAAEMFRDTDTAIHHEDEGFYSGLIGYAKPVSREIFGHPDLVDELAESSGSPLEALWFDQGAWTEASWRTYSRTALLFIDARFEKGRRNHSYAEAQVLNTFQHACSDAYKINGMTDNYGNSIEYRKVAICADFIGEALDILEKYKIDAPLKRQGDHRQIQKNDFFDNLAKVAFDLLVGISSINTTEFRNWEIQHNIYWSRMIGNFDNTSRARVVFRYRLQRIIFAEIREMEKYLNYKGARVLSLCLNVMGLSEERSVDRPPSHRALKKAVLRWTKTHFLRMRAELPDVASACLSGTISFDAEHERLVKTYSQGLSREPPREFLLLDRPAGGSKAT